MLIHAAPATDVHMGSEGLQKSMEDPVVTTNTAAPTILSDEDASDEDVWSPIPVRGVLSKWTNLLHGWQERYFVLSDGTLTYYRSEDEVNLGSRGSVRIRTAFVKPHEYDDCRFEVRVGDLIWYLRGVNPGQRQTWIEAIERHRVAESGYGSERTLNRPSSLVSLNSGHSPSISSSSSFKRGHQFREKLAEMETFKDILCKQVDSLQVYFDACSLLMDQVLPDRVEDWLKSDSQTTHSDDSFEDRDSYREHQAIRTPSEGSSDNQPTPVDDTVSFNRKLHGCVTSLSDVQLNVKVDIGAANSFSSGVTVCPKSFAHTDDIANSPETLSEATQCAKANPTPSGGFFSRFWPSFRTSSAKTPPEPAVVPQVKQESTESSITTRLSDLQRILKQYGTYAPDFRGESHMFKATTTGILTNLSHTIEMMHQHEEQWRKRLDRETERRRRLEETQRAMAQEMAHLRHLLGLSSMSRLGTTGTSSAHLPFPHSHHTTSNQPTTHHVRLQSCGQLDLRRLQLADFTPDPLNKPPPENRALFNLVGPDFEEGPNSLVREEEFYDAIDAESDKIEQDAARLAALKSVGKLLRSAKAMPSCHPLYAELEHCVQDRIRNFADPRAFHSPCVGNDNGSPSEPTGSSIGDWQVIAQEGDMFIYKREVETEDGVVLDPLQAVHFVHGVTAREMCTYFWDVQYRMDWEFTIDQAPTILEVCGDDTVVLHQVYKRVWPTTQRDSVFWSHIRHVSTKPTSLDASTDVSCDRSEVVLDSWMVVNQSTNYLAEKVSCSSTPMIRLGLDVVLYCQTVVDHPINCDLSLFATDPSAVTRNQIHTRLVYMANINPGGWVPAAGLRSLARREYPRFLKRFSTYVQEQTRDKPLLF